MRLTVRLGLAASAWLTLAVGAFAEDLTVTTYYPSPRGVYEELRTSGDVKIGDSSSTTPQGRLEVRGSTAASAARALYVGNLGGTARLVVEDGGNVGIGTASPANTLSVVGNADVSGNVGIGTPTPAALLDIQGGDAVGLSVKRTTPGHLGVIFDTAANTYMPVIELREAGTMKWSIFPHGDSEALSFLNQDGNIVMRLSQTGSVGLGTPVEPGANAGLTVMSGNVGIGTVEPTQPLHVVGNAQIDGTIRGATYGFGGIYSRDSGGSCVQANPFTGACSCPSGFTAYNFATGISGLEQYLTFCGK